MLVFFFLSDPVQKRHLELKKQFRSFSCFMKTDFPL